MATLNNTTWALNSTVDMLESRTFGLTFGVKFKLTSSTATTYLGMTNGGLIESDGDSKVLYYAYTSSGETKYRKVYDGNTGTWVSSTYQSIKISDTSTSEANMTNFWQWLVNNSTRGFSDYKITMSMSNSQYTIGLKVRDTTKTSYTTLPTTDEIATATQLASSAIVGVGLAGCYKGCSYMTTTPTIPNYAGLCNSYVELFSGCSALTTPPTFSDTNITSLENCFYNCAKLTTAPDLSVFTNLINMDFCFDGCSKLVTAPTIPSTVTNVFDCFSGCDSLRGTITVNSDNITSYYHFFTTDAKTPVRLAGSASQAMLTTLANACDPTSNMYISSSAYTVPSMASGYPTLTRCDANGTANVDGQYIKVVFKFDYFLESNDTAGTFVNNLDNLVVNINGINNKFTTLKDENNTSIAVADIVDLSKTYYYIVGNSKQLPMMTHTTVADQFNTSATVGVACDYDSTRVETDILKNKESATVIHILYPTIPADNVQIVHTAFNYSNVEDIIWNELFIKE